MGWLKKVFDPKSKDKGTKGIGALLPMPAAGRVNPEYQNQVNGNQHGVDWTGQLPQNVMQKIFEYVCPHTMDESYDRSEASALPDSCMLCDMRDLSYCVLVCKRWRKFAVPVLYRSIRIESVHYCDLEDELAERRKKKSKFNRNADPEDTGLARMGLLCRTLRNDELGLGSCILILKTPYMIRETCKADIARIAAVAPNLRYADLPEGFYSADASSMPLRQELENRCPDIRKMAYNAGSEKAIENLATGALWNNLEVLELNRLSLDPMTLRYVFGALQNLQVLKVSSMPIFTDQLFAPSTQLPPFPPINTLIIEDCPNVSVRGLQSYLSNPTVAHSLQTLDLSGTGVQPWDVHFILAAGRKLKNFSIIETVEKPFPGHLNIPPLQSRTLNTMHFEITAEPSATYTAGTGAYHTYLATSLLANGLPSLRELYVRDADFPESLVEFTPPMPGFMGDGPAPFRPSGTGGNRFSTASVTSNYTHNFGSSPPSKSGPFGLESSPETKQGAFAPSSFSPPAASKVGHGRGQSQQNQARQQMPPPSLGLKYPLEVFTKGMDEMEWNFSYIQPPAAHGRKASMTGLRPISQYGIENPGSRLSGVFGNNAAAAAGGYRQSVIVGNGFGGLLVREKPQGKKAFEKEGGRGQPKAQEEDGAFFAGLARNMEPPKAETGNVAVRNRDLF